MQMASQMVDIYTTGPWEATSVVSFHITKSTTISTHSLISHCRWKHMTGCEIYDETSEEMYDNALE